MGIFRAKHITIEKVVNEGDVQYFMNYGNLKKPMNFIEGLIQFLADNMHSLTVIDTNTFYIRSESDREDKIQDIIKELDKYELKYRDLLTKEDSDNRLLGIKIQNNVKVNCHKIGIDGKQSDLNNILAATLENNACFYFVNSDMQQEEVLNKFIEAGGNYEALSRMFGLSVYFDTYFKRVRINTNCESAQIILEKLNNYTESYRAIK